MSQLNALNPSTSTATEAELFFVHARRALGKQELHWAEQIAIDKEGAAGFNALSEAQRQQLTAMYAVHEEFRERIGAVTGIGSCEREDGQVVFRSFRRYQGEQEVLRVSAARRGPDGRWLLSGQTGLGNNTSDFTDLTLSQIAERFGQALEFGGCAGALMYEGLLDDSDLSDQEARAWLSLWHQTEELQAI